MVGFIGTKTVKLTEKNRVVIPKIFREGKDNLSFFLGTNQKNYCILHTEESWNDWQDYLQQLQRLSEEVRDLFRLEFSNVIKLAADAQSRIILPEQVLESLKLEVGVELVLVGVGDRIELWRKDVWQIYSKTKSKERSSIIAKISMYGK
ncbi:MAG: hypothetical protein ACOCXP_01865 [Candidatus Dojkabacteria bacterium]